MSTSLTVIYADAHQEVVASELAAELGLEEPIIIDGMLHAKDKIDAGAVVPEFILIDIGYRKEDILEEVDILATSCTADTKVVLCGGINDISFYRAIISRGVLEYYPYPADVKAIANTFQSTPGKAQQLNINQGKEGFAIGFMSAASGDGASTVALNTAYLLANKYNQSVVLVDLDYQFGMIARHLDLKAPYGIRELLEHPDRGVDAALLNKMLVSYGKNLKIVAAPNELRKLPNVRSEQIVELLDVLRSQFDFVLFDIQHVWVDWIASVITKLDHNVVIAQQWLRSLTHVTRLMSSWTDIGISSKHVSLVMNRSGSRMKEALSIDDFQRVSGLHIDFYLPNDTRTIIESENQGKTVIELGSSQLEEELNVIADHMYALHSGQPVEKIVAAKKKNLFSFIK